MKQEHINEIKAIIILAIGMILLASLISFVPDDLSWYTSNPNIPAKNLIRITGAYIAGSLLFIFGYSNYFMVIFLFYLSYNKFTSKVIEFNIYKYIGFVLLFCVISGLFGMTGPQESVFRFNRAGIVGLLIADFAVKYFGRTGAYIILFMLGTAALILTGEILIAPLFVKLIEWAKKLILFIKEKMERNKIDLEKLKPSINVGKVLNAKKTKEEVIVPKQEQKPDKSIKEDPEDIKAKIRIAPPEQKSESVVEQANKIIGEYHIPSIDLLDDPPQISTSKMEEDLVRGAKLLEETLANFGVSAKVADIERGPAITRYELEPAPGVKVQKFTVLSDDIALAMKAPVVRVVAPIPGKNRVGIEVPNPDFATVYLKEVLSTDEFLNAKSKLTMALGKDLGGKAMVADLKEMPHILIAGTTGSGKSVCVNSVIVSMLLNASPDELKFIMIDPKMVELMQFNDIPHMLSPTITDVKKASSVLQWVVGEMENRYKILSAAKVKNLKTYNELGKEKIPYIVVIIDELSDLMQVSAKTVESSITRIAQLSRAVGIHMILATQRPSVDVITGVIKANFPARISFKVASKVDSRTVLDMNGAESLLGTGDMLFIQPGDAKPTRGQGSFVRDKEIGKILKFIKDQQKPVYDDSILQQQKSAALYGTDQKDEYYDEAVNLVIETNQASVSILQRRMRLGYTRAARLIDMMEQNGIVGPYCGSKPRDILIDREQWLLENMKDETNDTE